MDTGADVTVLKESMNELGLSELIIASKWQLKGPDGNRLLPSFMASVLSPFTLVSSVEEDVLGICFLVPSSGCEAVDDRILVTTTKTASVHSLRSRKVLESWNLRSLQAFACRSLYSRSTSEFLALVRDIPADSVFLVTWSQEDKDIQKRKKHKFASPLHSLLLPLHWGKNCGEDCSDVFLLFQDGMCLPYSADTVARRSELESSGAVAGSEIVDVVVMYDKEEADGIALDSVYRWDVLRAVGGIGGKKVLELTSFVSSSSAAVSSARLPFSLSSENNVLSRALGRGKVIVIDDKNGTIETWKSDHPHIHTTIAALSKDILLRGCSVVVLGTEFVALLGKKRDDEQMTIVQTYSLRHFSLPLARRTLRPPVSSASPLRLWYDGSRHMLATFGRSLACLEVSLERRPLSKLLGFKRKDGNVRQEIKLIEWKLGNDHALSLLKKVIKAIEESRYQYQDTCPLLDLVTALLDAHGTSLLLTEKEETKNALIDAKGRVSELLEFWGQFSSTVISILRTSFTMHGRVVHFMLLLFYESSVSAFIPLGLSPVVYKYGDTIEVKAVSLTSARSQLPHRYYSLPFCSTNGKPVYKAENLGEILRGDRIVSTPYSVKMGVDEGCRVLCNSSKIPGLWSLKEVEELASRIQDEYYVNLQIDNLPSATKIQIAGNEGDQIELGYPLGSSGDKPGEIFINNYLKFKLKYNTKDRINYYVVGFEIEAHSVALSELKYNTDKKDALECIVPENPRPLLVPNDPMPILFLYSVHWEASNTDWSSRWNVYLNLKDTQIHWFSVMNSVIVILFLSGILTMILVRTLRRDISQYNSEDDEMREDTLEEMGWKLLHGDVFRPPRYRRLFCALFGSGIQVACMTIVTIFFTMLGILSPTSRGTIVTAAIFLYAFMGAVSGYFSARLYRTMKGSDWKKTALWTATLYPGVVFIAGFVLNFFLIGESSSGAVPFSTMISLLCIWLGVSFPLVFLGSYFGYRKKPFTHPVRTNQIPRQIPDQPWYMKLVFCMLAAGILPFGAMFIELFFLFSAIWENQIYFLFGFLFLVIVILIVSVSQIAIVLVYFQLCKEDYNWWWRSFLISGGSSVYLFAFSWLYFNSKLDITEFVPIILYFGYTTLMVFTFWLFTCTVGFLASYIFVRKIYSAVKID
ncbi:unnamed protein product [Cyprideis torosa]|uniref:Transmembrane 9 superfamily member 4 n=1 Tax=Cyprideis torosa TaxID=163714 RepID=A0A7R8W174_9CRUS|nr:unnamed protein product [Cyprideis torosa]CAG0880593.1 unnamed protein product [Cyprideis torosa]